MNFSKKEFEFIADEFTQMFDGVTRGKMMHSPGIKSNNKVFAFYHEEAMIFKLGKRTDSFLTQYPESSYLNPFKQKPPMKGWLVVPSKYAGHWRTLAKEALASVPH